MRRLRFSTRLFAAAIVAAIALEGSTGFCAQEMFLKIQGIPGELEDARHPNWIGVAGYSHRIFIEGDPIGGGGGTASRSRHENLVVQKQIDAASPRLNLACSSGQHFTSATLEVFRAGAEPQKFLEIALKDIVITSVAVQAPVSDLPMETVALAYRQIQWTYYRYDQKGRLTETIRTSWDVVANGPGQFTTAASPVVLEYR